MINAIFTGFRHLIQYVLGSPITIQNHAILSMLAFLSALFLYGRMADVTDMKRTTAGFLLTGVLAGFLLTLAVMVCADRFVIPTHFSHNRGIALAASCVIGALFVAAPVLSMIQRGSYGAAAFSWCTSLALAAFVVVIARTGVDLVTSSEQQGAKTKAREAEIEMILDRE